MKKISIFIIFLFIVQFVVAQIPNYENSISLKVVKGETILITLQGEPNTYVKIISGTAIYDLTLSGIISQQAFTANENDMVILGNVKKITCNNTKTKKVVGFTAKSSVLQSVIVNNCHVSAMDVSQCPALEELVCYANDFDSLNFAKLMASLPNRTGKTKGKFMPIYADTSSNCWLVLGAKRQIAEQKNWTTYYAKNNEQIPVIYSISYCKNVEIKETKSQNLNFYPNPTNKYIFIPDNENENIKIYDYTGKLILETNANPIDVGTFANGIYFIIVNDKRGKFIKL